MKCRKCGKKLELGSICADCLNIILVRELHKAGRVLREKHVQIQALQMKIKELTTESSKEEEKQTAKNPLGDIIKRCVSCANIYLCSDKGYVRFCHDCRVQDICSPTKEDHDKTTSGICPKCEEVLKQKRS